MQIPTKTPSQIEIMKKGGSISAKALSVVLKEVKPGVTTGYLDKIAEEVIRDHGASPSFMTVDDYEYATPAVILIKFELGNETISHFFETKIALPQVRQRLGKG